MTGEQKQTLHAKLVARLGPDFDACWRAVTPSGASAKKLPGGGRRMKLALRPPPHPSPAAQASAHDWYLRRDGAEQREPVLLRQSDCSSREIRFNAETLEIEILINDRWWLATDERWFRGRRRSQRSWLHGTRGP